MTGSIRGRILINRQECVRHAKDDAHQGGFRVRGSISDEDFALQSGGDDSDDSDSHSIFSDNDPSEDKACELLGFNRLRITDNVPASVVMDRLAEEIKTRGTPTLNSSNLVFKFQDASYTAKCKSSEQPEARLLELLYSNPANFSFFECQSWLQKAIEQLNGLTLDVYHPDDLCMRRDALIAQLNRKSSDLAAFRLSQWKKQFCCEDAGAKTATYDIDTSKSSFHRFLCPPMNLHQVRSPSHPTSSVSVPQQLHAIC